MLGIVIGLSLVATVATSTSSASVALAAFSGAQALVIIVPLIFVAIILLYAYSHASHAGGSSKGGLLIFVPTRIVRASLRVKGWLQGSAYAATVISRN